MFLFVMQREHAMSAEAGADLSMILMSRHLVWKLRVSL